MVHEKIKENRLTLKQKGSCKLLYAANLNATATLVVADEQVRKYSKYPERNEINRENTAKVASLQFFAYVR